MESTIKVYRCINDIEEKLLKEGFLVVNRPCVNDDENVNTHDYTGDNRYKKHFFIFAEDALSYLDVSTFNKIYEYELPYDLVVEYLGIGYYDNLTTKKLETAIPFIKLAEYYDLETYELITKEGYSSKKYLIDAMMIEPLIGTSLYLKYGDKLNVRRVNATHLALSDYSNDYLVCNGILNEENVEQLLSNKTHKRLLLNCLNKGPVLKRIL